MRKRWTAAMLATATMMVCASSASAVEVGNDCTATTGSNGTFIQVARASGGPFPLSIPNAGILTSWKIKSGIPAPLSTKLKIVRPGGKANVFTTVGESAPATANAGTNTFDARIPVQAGDRLGLYGPPGGLAFLCGSPNPGDEYGVIGTDPSVGSTDEYSTGGGILLAVSAVIEPDADGDGFGDESQDKCPRSAKVQAVECPLISLSSFGIAARNSALILLASSSSAAVTVDATVTVPGKSKKGKKGKARTLKLSGGAQTVAPGQLAQFVINYSVPLKAALTALPSKKTLTLNVTASTVDAAGAPSSTATTLKLKGQAKPKKKK